MLTRRPVYGRTTGVGANLGVAVDDRSGQRLLHSHAGDAGTPVSARVARATVVVRANQLLVGAAGVDPALIEALVLAANSGAHAALLEFGSIGTGDLTALARLALTLQGEAPWIGAGPAPFTVDDLDALALLSSSAPTIARAALAACELDRLADAAVVIAALTGVAVGASTEPFSAPVAQARPHPGSVAVAARMRELISSADRRGDRVQDPYGLRALPSVHGVLVDALSRLRDVVGIELNAGAENPLVSSEAGDVFHHGNFHQAPLAAALDSTRLALLSVGQLSTTRLSALMEPQLTGQAAFLADGPAGSSGLMILEYTAASALAAMRAAATPVTTGTAVISRGAEAHASFAPLAASQTDTALAALRVVLAAELVAAVRALRLDGREPAAPELRAAFAAAAAALPTDTADRPLDHDLVVGAGLLDTFGRTGGGP